MCGTAIIENDGLAAVLCSSTCAHSSGWAICQVALKPSSPNYPAEADECKTILTAAEATKWLSAKTPPLLPNCLPPSPHLNTPPTSVLSPLLCATSFPYPPPPTSPLLTHSFCVLCQKVLQRWYSVKRACQQLDLSLDPIHIPSSPSLWSYFDPWYPAQKGIHLIDFSCFNLKVAWASHYLIGVLIARFILLRRKIPASFNSPKSVNKTRSMVPSESV